MATRQCRLSLPTCLFVFYVGHSLRLSVCLSVSPRTPLLFVCLRSSLGNRIGAGPSNYLHARVFVFFLLPLLLPLTLQFTCQKSKVDIKHKHTDLRRHTHTHTPVATTLERAGKIAKKLCLQLKIEQMAFGFSSLFRCLRFYLN